MSEKALVLALTEWRHKEIELAAHELLQYLDRKSASRRGRPGRRGAS